ncbi:MAG: galactokinase, partial [Bacteroidota bacterium]
ALKFKDLFEQPPLLVRSPGRINLIGEHTDYNQGLVMPAAIDKEIRLGVAANNEKNIRIHSLDYSESLEISLAVLLPQNQKAWANFILGVVIELEELGHRVAGFDCAFEGDIPLGAGLSSSAALECAAVFGLNELFELGLSRLEMVQIAQKAENNFVGVQCGMMDQFASMFGRKDQVIRLDCSSLDYEYAPLDLQDYQIVLLDSQVKHSLADSEYNTRRAECEAAVHFLSSTYPQIQSLRDVTPEMLREQESQMNAHLFKRADYIVSENQRVRQTATALQEGNLKKVGAYLYESHQGLSEKYQVSCPELDFLVAQSRHYEEVLGARMMGGGFGGCTLNLVKTSEIEKYTREMARIYHNHFQIALKV